jgi:hypothetical protein
VVGGHGSCDPEDAKKRRITEAVFAFSSPEKLPVPTNWQGSFKKRSRRRKAEFAIKRFPPRHLGGYGLDLI